MTEDAGQVRAGRPWQVLVLTGVLVFAGAGGLLVAGIADAGPVPGLPAWTYLVLAAAHLALAWAVWTARARAWRLLLAVYGLRLGYYVLTEAWSADATTVSWAFFWPVVVLLILAGARTRQWFGS